VSDAPRTTDLHVDAGAACLTGHFPDRAVVPAAAILDRLAAWLTDAAGVEVAGIARARIKLALLPGTTWQVTAEPPADGRIKVTCTHDGRTAMTATFLVRPGAASDRVPEARAPEDGGNESGETGADA
jgi:3-hydroxymyristoyl/3-hydroxydecanoyl-(acyl carrier protein) dehydratase